MLVFFFGPLGTTIIQSSADDLGPISAASGAGLGTYLANATFSLNPVGDDCLQLPMLLLTATVPRTLVRGRVLVGVLPGIPVAATLPLVTVVLGTSSLSAVGFALADVCTCLVVTTFSVDIDAAYPICEEREPWGMTAITPSTLMLTALILIVGPGAIAGLVVTWFGIIGHLVPTPLLATGVGPCLLVTAGVSYGLCHYTARRYRTYTFD